VRQTYSTHFPVEPLGNLIEGFEGGVNFPPVPEGEPASEWRVLKISAVTWGEFNPYESKPISPNVTFDDSLIVRQGDLIMSRANTTELVGSVCLVRTTPPKVLLPDKLWRIKFPKNSKLLPEYALLALRSPELRRIIGDLATGTSGSMKNISMEKAATLPIPLPPRAEQKWIASIAQKADRLRRTRRYALQLSDTYLRSVFLEMFGSPVTNPKGWEIADLGSLSKVETGGTPSRADDSFYSGTIPWVKTSEVVGNIIYQTEEYLTEEGLKSSNCRLFPIGTILIAMYGQGLTRGRSAKLGIKATTNQACAAILPSSKISTDYLWSFLRISYDNLRDLGRGGNQPNLNLELVRSFNVPIPPLPLQEKFAQIVQKFDRLRTQQREADRQAEHLFQTILHRAFRGELTSQNADDEPESVLLQEIRAQQAKAEAEAKTATQAMGEAADYVGTKAKQQDIEPIQLKFPGFE